VPFRGRRAQDRDRSAKGLDPVFEADDAGAAARADAADAVVDDREGEGAVAAVHAHVDDRGPCVLCDVGNRLRRDVVGAILTKLKLSEADDDNRRVLAVITFLGAH
jgi:phage terminase large subunit-like protein